MIDLLTRQSVQWVDVTMKKWSSESCVTWTEQFPSPEKVFCLSRRMKWVGLFLIHNQLEACASSAVNFFSCILSRFNWWPCPKRFFSFQGQDQRNDSRRQVERTIDSVLPSIVFLDWESLLAESERQLSVEWRSAFAYLSSVQCCSCLLQWTVKNSQLSVSARLRWSVI